MIRRRAALLLGLALPALTLPTWAAEPVRILSGGALEPAVHAALARWRGAEARVDFATAPRIAQRLEGGEVPDLLLAPQALVDRLAREGRLLAPAVALGAVGVGIALREGADDPAIREEASFRAALLGADAIVFNRASTGLHVEALLARLGLAEALAPKILRFPDGDGVLRRLAGGSGREIGFAATTEILLFRGRGVRLAGTLPEGLQNRTRYAAALLRNEEGARAMLAFLDGAEARAAMAAAGVD